MEEYTCKCGHTVFRVKFQWHYGLVRMRCEKCTHVTQINLKQCLDTDDDIPF